MVGQVASLSALELKFAKLQKNHNPTRQRGDRVEFIINGILSVETMVDEVEYQPTFHLADMFFLKWHTRFEYQSIAELLIGSRPLADASG
ncbi:MAG TPA: hypothetical protein DD473_22320 [Planctomycetaceae bacterium]|nr:hypothetical protein [Planctomycetaceae bacterium]|tara:strand:+ start:360 stop:629 length:270 start_codon:yes stop_codon:yes gene_type:complete